MKTTALFLALLAMITLSTMAAFATPIKCAGCKTEYFLMDHLKGPFNQATGSALQPGKIGNKKAVQLLADGKIQFAFTCKPHQKLAKKFNLPADKTADWVSTAIARDPIVVVINPDCGIDNLTVDQLKLVFSGQVNNWSELGGNDLAVQVAHLDDSVESGIITVFKETTVGKKGKLHPQAKAMGSPNQLGNFAKSKPGTITFMGLNSYKDSYGKIVAIDSVLPEKDMIVQGAYPLAVTYHLVTHKGDNPGNQFLEYLGTPEGMALINEVMVAIPQREIQVP